MSKIIVSIIHHNGLLLIALIFFYYTIQLYKKIIINHKKYLDYTIYFKYFEIHSQFCNSISKDYNKLID